MRQIIYQRHEFTWPEPEDRSASFLTFVFDGTFDGIETWEEWILAVCAKHRSAYHERQQRAG